MNTQLAKNIRRYVDIKMEEEGIPKTEAKRLYSVFKSTYEKADPATQEKYKQNMKDKFQEVEDRKPKVEKAN